MLYLTLKLKKYPLVSSVFQRHRLKFNKYLEKCIYKNFRVLRSVEKFDPKTGSWTEIRSMAIARMAVACAKYREYIWVAGGMTGEKKNPVCKIVECYNSKTNE